MKTEKKMKILHIWDIASVGSVISDYINKNNLGVSYCIKRKKFDEENICSDYAFNILIKGNALHFTIGVIYEIIKFRPNIVHVHYWEKGVILAKLINPRSKIIMHYHGTDIRNKIIPKVIKRFSNEILVSTEDLMRKGVKCYGYPSK